MCKVYFYVWNELFHLLQVVFLEKYNPKFLPASWICCNCDFAKELDLCSVDLCTLLWELESAEMPCSSGFYFFLFFLPFHLLFFFFLPLVSLHCPSCYSRLWNHSSWMIFYANFFNEMGMCFFTWDFCVCDGKLLLSFSCWWLCLEGLFRLAEYCMWN